MKAGQIEPGHLRFKCFQLFHCAGLACWPLFQNIGSSNNEKLADTLWLRTNDLTGSGGIALQQVDCRQSSAT